MACTSILPSLSTIVGVTWSYSDNSSQQAFSCSKLDIELLTWMTSHVKGSGKLGDRSSAYTNLVLLDC